MNICRRQSPAGSGEVLLRTTKTGNATGVKFRSTSTLKAPIDYGRDRIAETDPRWTETLRNESFLWFRGVAFKMPFECSALIPTPSD